MTAFEDGLAARAAWARDVALFRYGMIRAAADPDLSPRQRGALVRALAAGEHKGPGGQPVRPGRSTLDRWIRDWRAGGFDALMPGGRQVSPRSSAGLLELAAALKKEKPGRSAAQVHRILAMRMPGQAPTVRTIQRHFVRMELTGLAGTGTAPETFGRFEAGPGELWLSDVLHGPPLGAGKSYLFGIEDDHSRFITGHWWATREDTLGLFAALRPAALRPALASRGVPEHVYVDNGSAFVDAWLLRACAKLGIKLVHSAPGRPPLTGQSLPGTPVPAGGPPACSLTGYFPELPACRVDRLGPVRVTRVP